MVVVDHTVERAVRTAVLYPTTCVAVTPFVVAGYGLVSCAICFKYDGKT